VMIRRCLRALHISVVQTRTHRVGFDQLLGLRRAAPPRDLRAVEVGANERTYSTAAFTAARSGSGLSVM
jgi:hypothetical protein